MKTRTIEELESFAQSVKELLESKAKRFGITNARIGNDESQDKPYEFVFDIEFFLSGGFTISELFTSLESTLEIHNRSMHELVEANEKRRYKEIKDNVPSNFYLDKVITEVRNSNEYKTLRNKPINPFLD